MALQVNRELDHTKPPAMDDQDDKRRLDERRTHNRLVLASEDLQEARTFALEVATNQDQLVS